MPLNFSFNNTPYIADGGHVWEDARRPEAGQELIAPAQAVVWYCYAVGINRLTADNIDRFLERCAVWDKVNGEVISIIDEDGKWRSAIDPSFVRQCVGFSTNVTPLTATQFTKKLLTGRKF
jgi:hypothetical protein